MNDAWTTWVLPIALWTLGLAIAAGVGLLAWRSIRSPLQPLPIPLLAWRQAWQFPLSHPRTTLAMAAISTLGMATQEYFQNTPGFDELTLIYASVGWQAIMAAAMAALAVPLAQKLIALEPYASFAPKGLKPVPRSQPRLYALAALTGLTLWIIGYGLTVGFSITVVTMPVPWQRPVAYLLTVFSFLVVTLLTFIRPALVSGYRNPVLAGLGVAARNCVPLYLIVAVMGLAPWAFEFVMIMLLAMFGGGLLMHVLQDAARIVFYLYQFLALESATIILFRGCVLQPINGFVGYDREPATFAQFRPY